jgi:hypothetical protein
VCWISEKSIIIFLVDLLDLGLRLRNISNKYKVVLSRCNLSRCICCEAGARYDGEIVVDNFTTRSRLLSELCLCLKEFGAATYDM